MRLAAGMNGGGEAGRCWEQRSAAALSVRSKAWVLRQKTPLDQAAAEHYARCASHESSGDF